MRLANLDPCADASTNSNRDEGTRNVYNRAADGHVSSSGNGNIGSAANSYDLSASDSDCCPYSDYRTHGNADHCGANGYSNQGAHRNPDACRCGNADTSAGRSKLLGNHRADIDRELHAVPWWRGRRHGGCQPHHLC